MERRKTTVKSLIFIFLFLSLSTVLNAKTIGYHVEKNFYYQDAISWNVYDVTVFNQDAQLVADVSTSYFRVRDSNRFIKNNYCISVLKSLHNFQQYTLFLKGQLGYTHFFLNNKLFDFIDTQHVMANIFIGINSPTFFDRYNVSVQLGYALITSTTVDPLWFNLGVTYRYD